MRCLLVYPAFTSQSFWNYRSTCELVGAKYPAAPLGMITVAAMVPQHWEIRLIDCNVEELHEEDLLWADIVFSGGMISQQTEHVRLIQETRRLGKRHVVGGPDATSNPERYKDADHLVLGEAEVSLREFLTDFENGTAVQRYEAGERKADVTTTPVPRFDLLKFSNYLHVGIQFARGCPFNCEFCDIIELFGRVPRQKKNEQILKELQTLYDLGYRGHVDLVDDNFIGNRNAVKKLLPEMKTWLDAHHHPFEFSTEATINLADDDALLNMMQDVGFTFVFVGIESPNEETLKQTQKGQNTKRSIPENIKKIYRHGIMVNAGYIIGFDSEKGSIANAMTQHIADTAIPVNMIGLLFALPNTQLSRRLAKEGRLIGQFDKQPDNAGDQCTGGINFETKRPLKEILKDYRNVLQATYSSSAYFSRVQEVGTLLNCSRNSIKIPLLRQLKDLKSFAKLVFQLGVVRESRVPFWRMFFAVVFRNPKAIRHTMSLAALYIHLGPFKDFLVQTLSKQITFGRPAAPAPEREEVYIPLPQLAPA